MEMEICKGHLKLIGNLEYSHSSPLGPSLSPSTSFIGRILPCSHLYLALPLIIWGYLSPCGVISHTLQILRFWKHQFSRTWWKCILSTSDLLEQSRRREYKQFLNLALCVRLTGWFNGTLRGFIYAIDVST